MSERFAPLTQLHEHPDNRYINWQLPLPEYSGVDELVLDVPAANRLAHLGSLLEVTFQPGRRQEEDQPVVGGMGGDGTASAAATLKLAKRKQRPDINLEEIYNDEGEDVPFWKNATISVDLDSITDRLSHEGQLRQPEAWAKQLNQVAWRGLRQAAIKNTHENSRDMAIPGIVGITCGAAGGTAVSYLTIDSLPSNFLVPYMLTMAAIQIPVVAAMELYDQIKKGHKANIRPDMIPLHMLTYAIDRKTYIAATALRHKQLIRHMPGDLED